MITPLLFLTILSASPDARGIPALAIASDLPQAEAPVPGLGAIADADIREYAALTGRKIAGRPVSGPYATADKLLLLARDKDGYPVIATSIGMPTRQSLPPPPPGTLAVVRLRQKSETIVPGPSADDRAFVAANKLPLFVVGEWARPAPMWEVAWLDDAARFRTVGEVGEIGPWQD